MNRISILLFATTLLLLRTSDVIGQLRIVTYNTATSGEEFSQVSPRDGMATVLAAIGNESTNGIVKPIDVLLLQEQTSPSTSTQAFADLLNGIYGEGVYARGRLSGGTNGGGRGGIVYNTQTVDLIQERSFGRLSGAAQARQTLRYQLRPIGYHDNLDFYAYVNHYKSGTSQIDQDRRNVEAAALRSNSDALGEGVHAIYAGDFNIRSCTEDMFGTLTGPGAGQAFDPVGDFGNGCGWHNNNAFRELHTQSPADGSISGLIQGGVDDRFDFQLVTGNLFDGEGLSLIPNSYHAFGNNGTHRLNQPINDSRNTSELPTALNALATTSDHLPVVADYQLPAIMQIGLDSIPERVIRGTTLNLQVYISNAAPVSHPLGADELDYTLEFGASGTPRFSQTGIVRATEGQQPTKLSLPTMFARSVSYGLNVRTDSQDAINRLVSNVGSYTVVEPALGSFAANTVVVNESLSQVVPFSEADVFDIPVAIFNLAAEGSAGLDLNSIQWSNETSFSTNLEAFENLAATKQQDFVVSVDTPSIGEYESQLLLTVSDEATIFGAAARFMTIDFSIRVALPGDANLDDQVNFADFLFLSGNFERVGATWHDGDFNLDEQIDFADFLLLSANFGQDVRLASVPEPDSTFLSGVLLLWVVVASSRRRR